MSLSRICFLFLQVIPTRKWCGCSTTSYWRRRSVCRSSTKRTGCVRSPSSGCNPGILGRTRSEPLTTWARRCVQQGSLSPTRGVVLLRRRKIMGTGQGHGCAEQQFGLGDLKEDDLDLRGSQLRDTWPQRQFVARITAVLTVGDFIYLFSTFKFFFSFITILTFRTPISFVEYTVI